MTSMYETYKLISTCGFILAIIMLVATVLIFFLFNIKNAIGDITGSNKRKGIQNISKESKAKVDERKKKEQKKYDTETLTPSGRVVAETVETAKIRPQDRYDHLEGGTTELHEEGTTILGASETTVLGASETTVLGGSGSGGETTVLGNGETSVLSGSYTPAMLTKEDADTNAQVDMSGFTVEIDITHVLSNEIIK